MTLKQHSLTLHFREVDEEGWEVLKGLSQDQQESVIKEALKLYLRVHTESRCPETTQLYHEYDREHDLSYLPVPSPWKEEDFISESLYRTDETGLPSEWKLDSLFVSSEIKKEITNPLKHLFQIIGEEDDEEVINFLSNSARTSATIPRDEESPERNDPSEIGTKESLSGEAMFHIGTFPLEVQQEDPRVRSSGLTFILQQVIGEEEDEEVLEFLRNSWKKVDSH